MVEETEEERKEALERAIRMDVEEQGAHVIEARESRLQLMRHKTGQLDSLANLTLEELEATRKEMADRLKVIE